MSYGVSEALQAAVYQALVADPTLTSLVGTAIYDEAPSGAVPTTYVSLGPEIVTDASDKTGTGARHDFTVSVVSEAAGFSGVKSAAAAVSDALIDANLVLSRGTLVALGFLNARARRVDNGDVRRIDLKFRARVDDT